MSIDSPGQYPPLSVLIDITIGPPLVLKPQKRIRLFLEWVMYIGADNCGVLTFTIFLTVTGTET